MSLPHLFAKALSNASKTWNLPTIDDETQELVQACLKDLNVLQSRITALALFSPNESLEDIGTRDLIYLIVPYVLSEVYGRVRDTERGSRLEVLDQTQRHLVNFLSTLEDCDIVSVSDRSLCQQRVSMIRDPRQKREVKIKQYQREKELRAKIEAIRKRRGLHPVDSEGSNDFDLISALLPSSNQPHSHDDDEPDSDTEDAVREVVLLLLRLMYLQAQAHMESVQQERELLKNAPPQPPGREPEEGIQRENRHTGNEDLWKLDSRSSFDPRSESEGPLLDSNGRPLRPFTILPSEASSRARLQAQVFGPGHQLPTMSIDEYLEIERQRGNVLTGGGRASQEAPTSIEKLTIASEMDGTREGDEKAEELRQKQETWVQFTDANPKGAGNRMNRG